MMKFSIPVVTAAALDLVPTWALAQGPSDTDSYGYGPHMMWWGGGYGMIFGPLIMILVLAAVIAAAVLLVRWVGGPWPATAPSHHTPLDILKERYARGEIDKEEYMRRRADLQD
jgi:putative membrane protein